MAKVIFYGVRGGCPVCEPDVSMFGGNTSCVALVGDDGRIGILDAGTGIRRLGKDIYARFEDQTDIYIAFSHFHWDHIQGWPFFKPAYDSRFEFTISAIGRDRHSLDLKRVFELQQQPEYFPVPMERMGAKLHFHQTQKDHFITRYGIDISVHPHNHPGGAFTYRIQSGDKTMVYSTDIEHGDRIDAGLVEFSKGADLLIHDAQYTPAELKKFKGWGHSSWEQAIEVAEAAGVKKLALFHHDPEHNDAFLLEQERICQRLFSECFFAREGMEIEL